MRREVRLDVIYPHSPERVWRALTNRKSLEKWMMPNDFLPLLGHRFRFAMPKSGKRDKKEVHCEVVELEVPHRLAYTWRTEPEGPPELVSWTLEPVEAGTRLLLEHISLEETTTPLVASAGTFWQVSLHSHLAAYLEKRSPAYRVRGRICLRNEARIGINRSIMRGR